MFCKKCGNQIPENAQFCPKCGAPTVHSESASTQQNTDDSPSENSGSQTSPGTPEKKGLPRYLLIIIIAVVAAVVIIIAAVAVHSHRENSIPSDETTKIEQEKVVEEDEGNNAVEEDEDKEAAKETTDAETTDEVTAEEAEANALKEKVTISDITFKEHETSDLVMGYDNIDYMVEMTVSNDNDVSCDVYPSLQATVEVTNGYGDKSNKEIHLLRSRSNMINSPYSRMFTRDRYNADDNYDEYMIPVGLAPHETKKVIYYMDGAYTSANSEFDFGTDGPITDVKLLDYTVEEAPYTYINISENLNNETGAITNTTGERWRTGGANYEQVTNGSPDSSSKTSAERYSTSGEYVDRDDDVIITNSDIYDAENETGMVPVLFWYQVDSAYSDNHESAGF